jgi:hypothetical protein
VTGLDVLARHRVNDRGYLEEAQPTLGVRVLARPPGMDGEPIGVQVVGYEGCAWLPHVRRVGFQPDLDLLQLGGQLLLGERLALLPLVALVPDGPPPAPFGPGRVNRDPAVQLDDFPAASGGRAADPAHEGGAPARAGGPPQPSGGTRGVTRRRMWGFCGDLGDRGRGLCHGTVALPAFMQEEG